MIPACHDSYPVKGMQYVISHMCRDAPAMLYASTFIKERDIKPNSRNLPQNSLCNRSFIKDDLGV